MLNSLEDENLLNQIETESEDEGSKISDQHGGRKSRKCLFQDKMARFQDMVNQSACQGEKHRVLREKCFTFNITRNKQIFSARRAVGWPRHRLLNPGLDSLSEKNRFWLCDEQY